MSTLLEKVLSKKVIIIFSLIMILCGIVFRTHHITSNDFVFYDEGFYLNHNRKFAEAIMQFPLRSFSSVMEALWTFVKICLSSGKSLWFIIVDIRFFFGGLKLWFFSKLMACLFGCATLYFTYRFAERFYRSQWIAWVSVSLLAVLPSHVFYSRIGLQESLSTFLVLTAFYFYIIHKEFGWRTVLSGILFGAAFFSNYRLIILPVLIGCCELWIAFSRKGQPDYRKFIWTIITFLCCVFLIGDLNDGQNTKIIFAWIFHQANLAEENFSFINILSYPYYLFRLDNVLFALFFFSGISMFFRKNNKFLLPCVLSLIQMGIFSFASEKGSRYLCVVFPFMVMSVAYYLDFILREFKFRRLQYLTLILSILMFGLMIDKSHAISLISSDYKEATEYLLEKNKNIKFLSTQNHVQSLYVSNKNNVKPAPQKFSSLLKYQGQDYKYIVVGPQAYISWGKENMRFHPELDGYMGFLVNRVKPIKKYDHFSNIMLERFVFEHSANLLQSIKFLKLSKEQSFGQIRIYNVTQATGVILPLLIKYHGGTRSLK